MLSKTLEESLHRALAHANARGHEFATLEHLLLSLTEDQDSVAVLRACNVDIDKLRAALEDFLDEDGSVLLPEPTSDARPTASFQRVIQRAVHHVQNSGRQEVTGANVLVAIFSERESHAVYFMQQQDMTRLDAVSYISHGVAKRPGMSDSRTPSGANKEGAEQEDEKNAKQGQAALEAYCVDLNQKARDGRIDPLIGRGDEVERTVQILCRRTKNNPLFVGDPGVGKTAIAEGLAKRIVDGEVPDVLDNAVIFALDMGSFAACRHTLSRRFRGASEGRARRTGTA